MLMILSFLQHNNLQNTLDLLVVYCKRWKLTINASKTEVITFRKEGLLPSNSILCMVIWKGRTT